MTSPFRESLTAQAMHAIDAATGAVIPPIHPATTFARDAINQLIGETDCRRPAGRTSFRPTSNRRWRARRSDSP